MSVTMAKADGVTVFTLTSDPQSSCPPLCQILKGLCYSPVCCSVSQHLRRVQKSSQSVLGALHIMVGLLNIGLGAILFSGGGISWWMMDIGFPFWLGALSESEDKYNFIGADHWTAWIHTLYGSVSGPIKANLIGKMTFMLFGAMSILSEKRPSPCLVILSVILNLAGVAFALTAIVLYSIQITSIRFWRLCRSYDYFDYYSRYSTPSRHEDIMTEKCLEAKALILMLHRGIIAVLIVLSVLELCVSISSAVLGIKALRSSEKKENKSTDDPESCKPLLEDVTNNNMVTV